MPYNQLDRTKLRIKPLSLRKNKVQIEKDHISIKQRPKNNSERFTKLITETAYRIKNAREKELPVMLTFGAHSIKNGMGPVIIQLMEEGWLTHLATNGAGIIHDWEFAFQGESSEDVRTNVDQGEFGIWEETGKFINLAILIGAYEGKGYGESVGSMIQNEGVEIPSLNELNSMIRSYENGHYEKASAAIDLL